jgi:hypothetical protein
LNALHVSSGTPLIISSSKTVFAASGLQYKPEAANTVLELLMMSDVPLETC